MEYRDGKYSMPLKQNLDEKPLQGAEGSTNFARTTNDPATIHQAQDDINHIRYFQR